MKIVHISDLHFGAHVEEISNHFIKEMERLNPDVILISGDLSQRAKSNQFMDIVVFIKSLSIPILAVPGNHDIPLWNSFARILYPFKNYNHFISPIIQTEFENNRLNIKGINSVNPYRIKDGRLKDEAFHSMSSFFNKSFDGLNLVFFHHNFDYLEGFHKPLENYEQFLSYLKDSPIHVVCTGHLHYAHANTVIKNDNKPCLILHAGSLMCRRTKDLVNSYYLLEVKKPLRCLIHWMVYKNEDFSPVLSYSIDLSKPHEKLLSVDEKP